MNYDYNPNEVQKLVEEYIEKRTPKERREIETAILEATVWQLDEIKEEEWGFAAYSESELEQISARIPDDDKRVNELLRRPYVKRL